MTHLAIQHPTTITPDMEDNTMETEVGIAQKTGLDHKLYEDRYRILDARAPLVRKADRGIIYGVMDGVGGAPRGMGAAQELCDQLQRFFRPGECEPTTAAIRQIIHDANDEVASWGCIPGTDRPLGAAAGHRRLVRGDQVGSSEGAASNPPKAASIRPLSSPSVSEIRRATSISPALASAPPRWACDRQRSACSRACWAGSPRSVSRASWAAAAASCVRIDRAEVNFSFLSLIG